MKTIAEQFEEEWYGDDLSHGTTIRNAIERIESRLTALESPKPEREWIDIKDDLVWTHWSDGSIILYTIGDYLLHKSNLTMTHIMPYHEGDKKPDPPEVK